MGIFTSIVVLLGGKERCVCVTCNDGREGAYPSLFIWVVDKFVLWCLSDGRVVIGIMVMRAGQTLSDCYGDRTTAVTRRPMVWVG